MSPNRKEYVSKLCNSLAKDAAFWHKEAVAEVKEGKPRAAAGSQRLARIAAEHARRWRLAIIND